MKATSTQSSPAAGIFLGNNYSLLSRPIPIIEDIKVPTDENEDQVTVQALDSTGKKQFSSLWDKFLKISV
ncbi:hypothetical protein P8452_38665 [Trifolium repens]|nr:hypothetical protein P8452_38665 [Trifolium repens]